MVVHTCSLDKGVTDGASDAIGEEEDRWESTIIAVRERSFCGGSNHWASHREDL